MIARAVKSVIEALLVALFVGVVTCVVAFFPMVFVQIIWSACESCSEPAEMAAVQWTGWIGVAAAALAFLYTLADEAEQ